MDLKKKRINPTKLLQTAAFIGGQNTYLRENAKPFVLKTENQTSFININQTSLVLKQATSMVTKVVSKKGLVLIHTKDINYKSKPLQRYLSSKWYGGYISNYKKNMGLPQLPAFIIVLPKTKKLYDLISNEVKKKKIPFCSLVQTTYSSINPTYPLFANLENNFVRYQFLTLFKKAIILGLIKETINIKRSS